MRLHSVLSRLEEATKLLSEVIRDHAQGLPEPVLPLRMSDLDELLKLVVVREYDNYLRADKYRTPPTPRETELRRRFEELLAPEWAKAEPAPMVCDAVNPVNPTLIKYVFRVTYSNNRKTIEESYGVDNVDAGENLRVALQLSSINAVCLGIVP